MRLLSLPAMLLGVMLAIVFFEIYGHLSRPSVPKPIAFVVDQFAPGVEIGTHVSDARHSVAAMSYVPHLGYVGLPGSRQSNMPNGEVVAFPQVRLLLDERARAQAHPNPAKVRIEAVEVVTAEPGAASRLADVFLMTFRRPPREGCVRTADGQLRPVRIWPTPNERGGLALITDATVGPQATATAPTMTSVLAFTGKFQGAATLRANYIDLPCADVGDQAAGGTPAVTLAAAASESLTVALSDSLGPSLGFVATQAGAPNEPLDACRDYVDSRGWESAVSSIVEMQVPPGFKSSGQIGQSMQWNGPGGWIRVSTHGSTAHAGWTGLITSECDVFISGAPTHVDLVTTSYGRAVHALIQPQDAPAIGIEAQGKTVGVQAQLLHAIRYARISAAWGR